MFQFGGFPAYDYFIHRTLYGSSPHGFPHSEIHGSQDICSSPWLIAACHVLRRLLMPRHSPCALLRLNSFCISVDILVLCLNCCNHISQLLFGKIVPNFTERPVFKSFFFTLPVRVLLYSVFNELSLAADLPICCVSALTYLPGQSPAKYCRHCAA